MNTNNPARPPVVWVPNLGPHDYSPAEQYGKLIYLTEGYINRFDVGGLARKLANGLEDAEPFDYLMMTSLPILCSLSGMILSYKFGNVKFLLYQGGSYSVKEVSFTSLGQDEHFLSR